MNRAFSFASIVLAAAPIIASAQITLTPAEQKIRETLLHSRDDQISYLERVVNIPSSTLNLAGVRKVGAVFQALRSIRSGSRRNG